MSAVQYELPMSPRGRVRLADTDPHEDLPRTDWNETEDPPCVGWWEVKAEEDPDITILRWWWTGARWLVGGPRPGVKLDSGLSGQEFREGAKAAWRGLVKPSPLVYPTPPYDTKTLVLRGQAAGVAVRTQYVTVTPRPRQRVML